MAIEGVPLRQLEANTLFTFTYTGNLAVEDTKYRLYNDTNGPRIIKKVRASVGETPIGSYKSGAIINILKNGISIFDLDIPILSDGSGMYPRLFIPPGSYTDVGEPKADTVWEEGEYLTVSIEGIGSLFAGADLTINVVVSE